MPASRYNPPMTARHNANIKSWDADSLARPHAVQDKAERVRCMFDAVAPRYELINKLMTGGNDARWRRKCVELSQAGPDDEILDIACGTGDVARTFASVKPKVIVGADFSREMLARAVGRLGGPIAWCEADAQQLPFADEAFTITACAFGVRNFQDLRSGLAEMYRVLKPGGRTVILEAAVPPNPIIRFGCSLYSRHILPHLASWISRDGTRAYHYLPSSIKSFATRQELCDLLRDVGFARVTVKNLMLGTVAITVAWKDD